MLCRGRSPKRQALNAYSELSEPNARAGTVDGVEAPPYRFHDEYDYKEETTHGITN